jgi:hypothetical protein
VNIPSELYCAKSVKRGREQRGRQVVWQCELSDRLGMDKQPGICGQNNMFKHCTNLGIVRMYGVDKHNACLSGAVSVRNNKNTSRISESGTFTNNGVKITWNCNIVQEEQQNMHEENKNTLTEIVMCSVDNIEYDESPLNFGLAVASMQIESMDCTDGRTEVFCEAGSGLSEMDDDIFTGTGPVVEEPTFNENFRKFQATQT